MKTLNLSICAPFYTMLRIGISDIDTIYYKFKCIHEHIQSIYSFFFIYINHNLHFYSFFSRQIWLHRDKQSGMYRIYHLPSQDTRRIMKLPCVRKNVARLQPVHSVGAVHPDLGLLVTWGAGSVIRIQRGVQPMLIFTSKRVNDGFHTLKFIL